MKKSLLLSMALLAIVFIDCSKDEKENVKSLDSQLVGTKWQTRDPIYEAFFGGIAYDVYEFISTSEVEQYTISNGSVVDSNGTHKYILNYPSLSIVMDDKTTYDFEFKDSRTIIRKGANEYLVYAKYVKQ